MKEALHEYVRRTSRKPKKLIVCCDGTWKNSTSAFITTSSVIPSWCFFFPTRNPDEEVPSNITRIGRATKPVDSNDRPQIIFYQASIGTQGGILMVGAESDPTFSITLNPADVTAWITAYKARLRRKGYALPDDVPIQAIGVWKTVGALRIPLNPVLQRLGLTFSIRPYRSFDTSLSNAVKFAFRALALDEQGNAYYPAVWERPQGVSTVLQQTWFPGVHTGVGGGYRDTGPSNITWAWMMSQLAPFVDLDSTYLRKQFGANRSLLKMEKAPQTALQWAALQLLDSTTGLRALLGVVTRTPGRYHRFDRRADWPERHQPLMDTNEHVH
ncbi:hypothetical protein LTR36_004185 [Oleoguttula mirabilis]|uniref:T6SS Phospholipase effector Tle1-like catalytic domain-containing protein n=1 Tax=Oleoguttula mirabilis TaxID=1507867 RepID=A0AAV9JJE4_9PEZI|nr:hypothetical protein LTR36_004185 [Oleoguttula mirabilis]